MSWLAKYTGVHMIAFHWDNIASSSCLPATPKSLSHYMAQIEQVYWKKYLLFFYLELSGYLLLSHKQEWNQNRQQTKRSKLFKIIVL